MKKILVLLFMILFINTCFAAEWVQVAEKTWVDLSSIKSNNNIVSGWFKDLNPGNWDRINNQKIYYTMTLYYANCKDRLIGYKTLAFYDYKGKIIIQDTEQNLNLIKYLDVIPGSVGEWKYEVLCRYKNNNSFNWDDYETEKP